MRFTDVWLPEVVAEYRALLRHSRDVGNDVGNQFRAFEHVLDHGPDPDWRAYAHEGAAAVYVMYGRYALMCFALTGTHAAVVKWAVIGTEHAQHQALAEAARRASATFP